MNGAIGTVLPYAIGVAISPVPIIAVILMLFSARARQNGPAFLAGWALALLLVGGLVLVLAEAGRVGGRADASNLAALIEVLLGVLLLLAAMRQWQSRPVEGQAPVMPKWMATIDSFTIGRSFGLALLLAGPNPKNLMLTVGASLAIAETGATGIDAAIGLLVFVLVASLTVALPVLYYLAAGEGASTREKLRQLLRQGRLDGRSVDVDTAERTMPMVEVFSNAGLEEMGINFKDMLGGLFPKGVKRRRLKVPEALEALAQEEAQNLVDFDRVVRRSIEKVEQSGIIFIDEIDKIVAKGGASHGPDVSREGVQRDLLPVVEGCTVTTKHGPVKTDHILFIASGAFHTVKPSDLIPELQGRFPIRVELDALGEAEFLRILTEPRNALLLQYRELLRTDGVEIEFTPEAIAETARLAEVVNSRTENIGARRLHTLMERLLEEILFDAPDRVAPKVVIDKDYVERRLKDIIADEDLSRYIL